MNKAELKARQEQLVLEGEILRLQLLKEKLVTQKNLKQSQTAAMSKIRGFGSFFGSRQRSTGKKLALNSFLLLLTRMLPKRPKSLLGKIVVPLIRGAIVLNSFKKSRST